jgi:hypothetical protein
MRVDALHRQGRIVNEAELRTKSAFDYKSPIPIRQRLREIKAKSILGQLLNPEHPLNKDPENADERASIIRTLADMGMVLTTDPSFRHGVHSLPTHREPFDYEIRGPSASDPTKTGPGTAHANVQDLRRYHKFAR